MASQQPQGAAAVLLGKTTLQCRKSTAVWGANFDPICSLSGTSLPNFSVQWTTGQAEPDITEGEGEVTFIVFLALYGC